MPKKTLLTLAVSQDSPLVAVFNPKQTAEWMFIQHLLAKKLRVAVVGSQEPPFSSGSLQLNSRGGGLKSQYVVDFGWQKAASLLAVKNNSRFLRVIAPDGDLDGTLREMKSLKIDWRLVQAGHVYGLSSFWQPQTPLDHFFLAAVLGRKPQFSPRQQVFPVYNQDFVHGLFLSLFSK